MKLDEAVYSITRLPVLFLEQGVSLAAAALRLAGRVVDRGDAPAEYVEPVPVVVEPDPLVVEPEPPLPPEPVHVSEEPVLVSESAEAGAQDGAGAELRIEEPWEGYGSMSAAQIRSRLRGADAATAAAVRLYEAAHKGRSTVLQAASERPSG